MEKITGDNYELFETEPFNISSSVSVWRIVWQYEPRTDIPEDQTFLTINVYAGVSDDDRLIIISRRGIHNGDEQTRYFHEQGVFHLEISSNTQNFSVRVEKSMGYTPEPPTDNWAEVTRFIGSTGYTTNNFDCDHVEWRIKWKYDPGHIHFPFQYFFEINVIAQKEDYLQDYFVYSSSGLVLEQEGILNFYDDNGKFFLNILASGSSTIIVEQNTDSRPIVESSNNWVEIAAYTGITKGVRNESFTSDCDEWRIRWSHNSVPGQLQFNFTIDEVDGEYSETLTPENEMGIMYIFKAGSFNLTIHSNATRYSLIVEKNLELIPEFPSMTILISGLLMITIISIIYRHKRKLERARNSFKLLIISVNSLLSLIYVLFSYRLWEELNNWHDWRFQSTWTPFYIYSHRIPSESTVLMPNPFPMLNFPFIIFCVIIVTNCVMLATYFFFIPRIQRLASQNI